MPLESKLLFRYVNGMVTDFVVYTFPWGEAAVCVYVVCAFSAPAFLATCPTNVTRGNSFFSKAPEIIIRLC